MRSDNMFYVYEWYIVETGEIFYVGKGHKNRYKVRKHNKLFDETIKKFNCESRIVEYFEDEQEAFLFEDKRIEELKKIGQCSCNINKGGIGGDAKHWNEEMRKKYSKNNVMKSQDQRNRMSEKNPMKNPETALKVGKTKRKKIMVDDKVYDSFTDAVNVYGGKIHYWLKRGYSNQQKPCYYVEDGPKQFKIKRHLGGAEPVVYNGKVYDCAKDVCKEFNISESTLSKYIKRGYTDKGIECRKLSDKPVKEYIPYTNGKPVYIDGVLYPSILQASIETGLDQRGIKYALKHSGYYKNIKCEYVNQQPIPVKSEYSNGKGSETNE